MCSAEAHGRRGGSCTRCGCALRITGQRAPRWRVQGLYRDGGSQRFLSRWEFSAVVRARALIRRAAMGRDCAARTRNQHANTEVPAACRRPLSPLALAWPTQAAISAGRSRSTLPIPRQCARMSVACAKPPSSAFFVADINEEVRELPASRRSGTLHTSSANSFAPERPQRDKRVNPTRRPHPRHSRSPH
jgi:hypothetical protein